MQGKNSKKRYMISISTNTAYFMFVNYSLKSFCFSSKESK